MTTSQTKLMEQCHAEAMDKYPPAWGPSPGGMSIDHNHVPRKAYAQTLYDVKDNSFYYPKENFRKIKNTQSEINKKNIN